MKTRNVWKMCVSMCLLAVCILFGTAARTESVEAASSTYKRILTDRDNGKTSSQVKAGKYYVSYKGDKTTHYGTITYGKTKSSTNKVAVKGYIHSAWSNGNKIVYVLADYDKMKFTLYSKDLNGNHKRTYASSKTFSMCIVNVYGGKIYYCNLPGLSSPGVLKSQKIQASKNPKTVDKQYWLSYKYDRGYLTESSRYMITEGMSWRGYKVLPLKVYDCKNGTKQTVASNVYNAQVRGKSIYYEVYQRQGNTDISTVYKCSYTGKGKKTKIFTIKDESEVGRALSAVGYMNGSYIYYSNSKGEFRYVIKTGKTQKISAAAYEKKSKLLR